MIAVWLKASALLTVEVVCDCWTLWIGGEKKEKSVERETAQGCIFIALVIASLVDIFGSRLGERAARVGLLPKLIG